MALLKQVTSSVLPIFRDLLVHKLVAFLAVRDLGQKLRSARKIAAASLSIPLRTKLAECF